MLTILTITGSCLTLQAIATITAEIGGRATLLIPAVSAKLNDQGGITQTIVAKVHSEPIASCSSG